MTEKLYYKDAYIRDFEASVLSYTECDGGYDLVLDRTAFFPEEGGQYSDGGVIGGFTVMHVYEKDGVVHHITDGLPKGDTVVCSVDFEQRHIRMQCHTAEHILCGIIHSLFGLDNVGFHLGDDEVTFDVNGLLDREQLDRVEELANKAVFANIAVTTMFPTADELSGIEYRSKLDITDGVRLVKIGDIDTCACCAPHVSSTGEIGLIKILDFTKHRGGTRIWMVAGMAALKDYRAKYDNIKRISAILSAPQLQTADTLQAYVLECDQVKAALKQARLSLASLAADRVESTEGSGVYLLEDFSIPELIAFSNVAVEKIGDILVAMCGSEGDYKYVISSRTRDMRAMAKEINSALRGRGGGRPEMIQGSFSASLEEIKNYFNK